MKVLFASCVWNGLDLLWRMRKWGRGWSLICTSPMHEPRQYLSNHASRLSVGESLGKMCQYEQGKREQKHKEVADIGCMCSWESAPLQKSNTAQQRPASMITQSEFTMCQFAHSILCRAVKFSLLCEIHASTSSTSKCYAVPWQHWDTFGLTTWCQHSLRETFRSISSVLLFCSNPFWLTENRKFEKSIWSIQWGKAKFQEISDDQITERHTIIFSHTWLLLNSVSYIHREESQGKYCASSFCFYLI